MIELFPWLIIAYCVAFLLMSYIIPKLKQLGIVGHDVNKPDRPEVAEMGGLGVIGAVVFILIFIIAFQTFNPSIPLTIWDNKVLGAILASILIFAVIGVIDDLYSIPQLPKAVIPMLAGIPLLTILSSTFIYIPIIGNVDFGIFYYAILFLSLAVSSNLTNMLAGFNGMEWGMAIPMFFGSFFIGFLLNIPIVVFLSGIMLGACIAGFVFGFPIAKAFPGDVGTLCIGGMMAIILFTGHIERYAIVFIPYIVDFVIKAKNGMPSRGWWGTYRNEMLHCDGEPKGFAQTVMKWANGISEIRLVMWFIAMSGIFMCLGYVAVMWP